MAEAQAERMDQSALTAIRARKTCLLAAIEGEDAVRLPGWEARLEELSNEASAVDLELALAGALARSECDPV